MIQESFGMYPYHSSLTLRGNTLTAEETKPENASSSHLFGLQLTAHQRLFRLLEEKGIFSYDTYFIKEVPLPLPCIKPHLLQNLLKELNKLSLVDLLLHIRSRMDIYKIEDEGAFKLVGSWLFWILGADYVFEVNVTLRLLTSVIMIKTTPI